MRNESKITGYVSVNKTCTPWTVSGNALLVVVDMLVFGHLLLHFIAINIGLASRFVQNSWPMLELTGTQARWAKHGCGQELL